MAARQSPYDTCPERRPLRIFAFDPMLSRAGDHRVTIEIPYRPIYREERMFRDDRLEVVDYDAATEKYFAAVDLNNQMIAMTQGLEPLEHDPQFHQQMVYAVASKVLENFDRALGRRLRFKGGDRLRLYPHAFQGRNAYYDDELNAVLFGYFVADEDDPGPNLPGQLIFTCLSHDIVAHEVAHAALSRLHKYYNEPTNRHVPALHEAFADIVAVFQRLTFPEVVAPAIRLCRGDLFHADNPLLDIGAQFGSAAGKGGPLRRLAGKPDPSLFALTEEPHDLGWILVSAIYEGFVSTYVKRTRDLLRLATGGSGRLPDGELHPDLVNRLTQECIRTAQSVLSMCIRGTDYLPPVDPTFSDFLRAIVTADFELNRADDSGLRAAMIESFRQRGIRPESVDSLAVESLLLTAEDVSSIQPDPKLAEIVSQLVDYGARQFGRTYRPVTQQPERKRLTPKSIETVQFGPEPTEIAPGEEVLTPPEDEEPDDFLKAFARHLTNWAKDNRARLKLVDGLPVALRAFHPVHRIAASGELLVEMVAHFVQTDKVSKGLDLGGLKYRAGVTLIANIDGYIRYLISKPFHGHRMTLLHDWVRAFDKASGSGWSKVGRDPNRLLKAFCARAMDRRRWR
ncbi:MAG: hypothetical protein LZF62_480227 [Nitrospira sp.]|nr:MAG: hypothetical protein LZF62_480227 [Nitrospira sp.]